MPGMFELMFSVLLSLLCIFVVFRSPRFSERSPQSRLLLSLAAALIVLPGSILVSTALEQGFKLRNRPQVILIFAAVIIVVAVILLFISIRPSTWKGWTKLVLLILAVCCIGAYCWLQVMVIYMGSYNPLELAKYIGPT